MFESSHHSLAFERYKKPTRSQISEDNIYRIEVVGVGADNPRSTVE